MADTQNLFALLDADENADPEQLAAAKKVTEKPAAAAPAAKPQEAKLGECRSLPFGGTRCRCC